MTISCIVQRTASASPGELNLVVGFWTTVFFFLLVEPGRFK
jgi:hypothetical protein